MRLLPSIALTVSLLSAASAGARPADTVKPAVTATPVGGTGQPGEGQAPIATDPVGSRPADTAAAQAMLSDVVNAYDQMEKNVELQFAKLTHDAKGSKDALEEEIKALGSQILKLEQAAKKIEAVAQKMQELLPKIMAAVGSDPGAALRRAPSTAKESAFEALLKTELAKAGVSLSTKEIQSIAEAITKGGQAAMSAALQIVITIAEAGVGKSPDFPKVLPADLSAAAQLPGAAAASFLSKRFSEQASQKIAETNQAIKTAQSQIKALKEQIKEIDRQIAKLEEDKQKALAETRKQKEKALEDALKARDSRVIRLRTPTPTPKRP
ncbi:MAG: hypothetical protein NEA02_11430 [Thermoanaerobaculia bacterium]|nr:hypothetical protein [Thermoanaerobaculia bacterium]